jgi:single-strand DNA-binding protein
MYNKVFLIGNLTRDPELRYTPAGIPVARFTVAVNRPKKDKKDEVDFIPVVAWRRLAEICGEFLKKGRPVAIEGRLQIRSFKTRTGVEATMTEVVADGMQMLGAKPAAAPAAAPEAKSDPKEEEIPF